jgi:hypothetical protein
MLVQTDKVVRYEMRSSTQEKEEEEVLILPSLFHRAGVNHLSTQQARYLTTGPQRGPNPISTRRGNNNNNNDDM